MKRADSQVLEEMSEKLLAGALWAVPAAWAPLAEQHPGTDSSVVVSVVMQNAPDSKEAVATQQELSVTA